MSLTSPMGRKVFPFLVVFALGAVGALAGCAKNSTRATTQSAAEADAVAANAAAVAAQADANAKACSQNVIDAQREFDAAQADARELLRPRGTPEEERRIAEEKYARAQERLRQVTNEGAGGQ